MPYVLTTTQLFLSSHICDLQIVVDLGIQRTSMLPDTAADFDPTSCFCHLRSLHYVAASQRNIGTS